MQNAAPFATQWTWLNNLPNSAGTPYPVDGSGKNWKDPLFNNSTSGTVIWSASETASPGSRPRASMRLKVIAEE